MNLFNAIKTKHVLLFVASAITLSSCQREPQIYGTWRLYWQCEDGSLKDDYSLFRAQPDSVNEQRNPYMLTVGGGQVAADSIDVPNDCMGFLPYEISGETLTIDNGPIVGIRVTEANPLQCSDYNADLPVCVDLPEENAGVRASYDQEAEDFYVGPMKSRPVCPEVDKAEYVDPIDLGEELSKGKPLWSEEMRLVLYQDYLDSTDLQTWIDIKREGMGDIPWNIRIHADRSADAMKLQGLVDLIHQRLPDVPFYRVSCFEGELRFIEMKPSKSQETETNFASFYFHQRQD